MGAPRQQLAAHATHKAVHVEDQAGHRPHHQVRVADRVHASRALHPEDFIVVGTAVVLEVAYEARVLQRVVAYRAPETIFVVVPLADSHHKLLGDDAPANGANRVQAGLRLHGNGRLCATNGRIFFY